MTFRIMRYMVNYITGTVGNKDYPEKQKGLYRVIKNNNLYSLD